jgi:hypothetical protein
MCTQAKTQGISILHIYTLHVHYIVVYGRCCSVLFLGRSQLRSMLAREREATQLAVSLRSVLAAVCTPALQYPIRTARRELLDCQPPSISRKKKRAESLANRQLPGTLSCHPQGLAKSESADRRAGGAPLERAKVARRHGAPMPVLGRAVLNDKVTNRLHAGFYRSASECSRGPC